MTLGINDYEVLLLEDRVTTHVSDARQWMWYGFLILKICEYVLQSTDFAEFWLL